MVNQAEATTGMQDSDDEEVRTSSKGGSKQGGKGAKRAKDMSGNYYKVLVFVNLFSIFFHSFLKFALLDAIH